MTRFALALAAATALFSTTPASANEDDWATASDVVRASLVAAALGVPLVQGDENGAGQAALSVGAAYAVTFGLKEAFPTLRPDGSDRKSFPSSHTSTSFAAAASLQQRHGWDVGIPAHIAAAFVGLARVEARKHRWGDVLVGAAIGEAAGLLLTSEPDQSVAVIPWGDTSGGGVSVIARF